MLKVTTGHPSVHITIATESGKLSFVGTSSTYATDFDKDVLSVSVDRDLSKDCATFSLSIVYRNDWFTKIASNDLVIIAIQRPPEEKRNIMVGLVDDIRTSIDISSGKPQRAFTITGRGLNKALVNFTVGTIKELDMVGSSLGFFSKALDVLVGGTPAKAIKGTLDFFVGKGCNYSFANGENFKSYYREKIIDAAKYGEKLIDCTTFLTYQGGLWSFLKELKNAPFNEMFWEIYGDKPTLVFRPTPFDLDDWYSLEQHIVREEDIIHESIGRSDLETYVFFRVKADVFGGNTDELYLRPYWWRPFYPKYGIRRLEVSAKYLQVGDVDKAQVMQQDLFNWNIKNNIMENGSIIVRGSNQFRIGERVLIESTDVDYYCEGVKHEFTFGTGWTTTLSLTRGLKDVDRYTTPWGKWEEITTNDCNEIMGYQVPDGDASKKKNSDGTEKSQEQVNEEKDSNVPDTSTGNKADPQWKQYDSKWGSDVMTTKTLKQVGCLCTSVSILLKMTGLTEGEFNPGVLNEYLRTHSGYSHNDFIWTSTNSYVKGWRYVGIKYLTGTEKTKLAAIKDLISQGYYITVAVKNGGHWVAVTGYSDTDIKMSDPASDSTDLFVKYGSTIECCGYFACSVPFTTTKASSIEGSTNEQKMFNFFTGVMKFNDAVACGILANAAQESNFEPTATSSGYGIFQWKDQRLQDLKDYCSQHKYDYTSLEGQLQFTKYELGSKYTFLISKLRALQNTDTGAYDSGYLWCYEYHIPADRDSNSKSRGNIAKTVYYPRYIMG